MPFDEPLDVINQWREKYLRGPDSALYGAIGAFICWYSIIEVHVTAMLADLVGTRDYERFDFLVRGMDARAKIERLFSAAPQYIKIGLNLKARLDRFKNVSIPIRNQIAHSSPQIDDFHFRFTGIATRPDTHQGGLARPASPKISIDDFTRETMWLHLLAEDLTRLWPPPVASEFEIIAPRSGLP